MTNFTEEYQERKRKREKTKKEIIADSEYINWLEEFTENTPHFTSDLQSEGNTENIRNLDLLYEIIDTYARKNYIQPNKTKWEYFYILEYEGNLYKIGYSNRDYTFYYCNKVSETKYKPISFSDIAKDRVTREAHLINLKLEKLNIILSELAEFLPEEEVQRKVAKVYKKN